MSDHMADVDARDWALSYFSSCDMAIEGSMRLSFDKPSHSYMLFANGRAVPQRKQDSCSIKPLRITRVSQSSDGGAVRLSGSNIGKELYLFDLRFEKDGDAQGFVTELTEVRGVAVRVYEKNMYVHRIRKASSRRTVTSNQRGARPNV